MLIVQGSRQTTTDLLTRSAPCVPCWPYVGFEVRFKGPKSSKLSLAKGSRSIHWCQNETLQGR
jgi:hypothetical protein